MKVEHIVRQKSRNVILFNADLWNSIDTFTAENFDSRGVIVDLDDTSAAFESMSEAYEYICANTERINTITVLADYKTEQLEIAMYNKRMKWKVNLEIYCECVDGVRESKIRSFMTKLKYAHMDREGQGVYFGIILLFNSLNFADRLIRYKLGPYYIDSKISDSNFFLYAILIFGAIFFIYSIILYGGLVPLLMPRKKGIEYLIEYEKIAHRVRKKKQNKILEISIFAIWNFTIIFLMFWFSK